MQAQPPEQAEGERDVRARWRRRTRPRDRPARVAARLHSRLSVPPARACFQRDPVVRIRSRLRVTPRTSAFRHSARPVLGAVWWRPACATAHQLTPGRSSSGDRFHLSGRVRPGDRLGDEALVPRPRAGRVGAIAGSDGAPDAPFVAIPIVRCRAGAEVKAVVRGGAYCHPRLGDSASQLSPDGAVDRTSTFPESTRPRRHMVAVGAGVGCGRLLSVDCGRPLAAPVGVAAARKRKLELVRSSCAQRNPALSSA
jgi:hypothetical protein